MTSEANAKVAGVILVVTTDKGFVRAVMNTNVLRAVTDQAARTADGRHLLPETVAIGNKGLRLS